jgi:predicted enzyme related to lactoylglutathione lyase
MSIQVKEIAFVFYPIKDLAASRKFYEELLGLKIGMQLEFAPGQWWIEYDIGGQALAMSNAIPTSPQSALALEVASLDATLAAVKAAGVTVLQDVAEFPVCRMFQIKDPNGNDITVHQRKTST